MVQPLSFRTDSPFLQGSVSFCPQPWDHAAPFRIHPVFGAVPATPQAAYAPFSLGFRDAQAKRPQPQARDAGAGDHPAQAQAAQVHVRVAFEGLPSGYPPEDEGAARRLPQKNTFIHFDVPDSLVSTLTKEQIRRWRSAPGVVQTAPYRTKHPEMEHAHWRSECKPCAYHIQKTDGCRWGEQCSFCHLCPTGEVKRRKKAKLHAIKVQGISRRGARKTVPEKRDLVSP